MKENTQLPKEVVNKIIDEAYDKYIEMVRRLDQPQPGAVWVKAKDRLPEKCGKENSVIVKGLWHGKWPFVGYGYRNFSKDDPRMYYEVGNQSDCNNDVEWLDESAAGISQDAHEKEVMMQAFDKVRQIFVGRQWIMEGRGSYPYNDDRYQQEVRYMYEEFDQVVKDTWANIKSKSVDYRKAIIAEYLESAAGREDAVVFAEWAIRNATVTSTYDGWIYGSKRYATAELYNIFKQKEKL